MTKEEQIIEWVKKLREKYNKYCCISIVAASTGHAKIENIEYELYIAYVHALSYPTWDALEAAVKAALAKDLSC